MRKMYSYFHASRQNNAQLTFNNGQGAPLSLAPPGTNEPLVHLADKQCQILRIGPHDLIELGKLPGPKEHLRDAEPEVGVLERQGPEQRLAEESRIESRQRGRHVILVHVVEVLEAGARRVALLHETQHARHARALQLTQNLCALEPTGHHPQVGLHTANEVGAGGAEPLKQVGQLRAELASHAAKVQLARVLPGRVRLRREQLPNEPVATVVDEKGQRAVQGVVVLLDELTGGVDDAAGEVPHQEALVVADLAMRLELGLARHVQSKVLGVLGVHLGGEVSRRGRGQAALLVEQVEDARGLALDQVYAVLVVDVGDLSKAKT